MKGIIQDKIVVKLVKPATIKYREGTAQNETNVICIIIKSIFN